MKIEAEDGTLAGQSRVVVNSTSSNNSHIEFTSAPTPGQPTVYLETFSTVESFNSMDKGLDGPICTAFDCPQTWPGDHNMNCEGPTTQRTVHAQVTPELHWWCAPGNDPAKGHFMSSLLTKGYNVVWASPSRYFRDVSKVCWDVNITWNGRAEWGQVVLATRADVDLYDNDRLSLGFVNPDFRDLNGPTNGLLSHNGTVGIRIFATKLTLFRDGTWLNDPFGFGNGDNADKIVDRASRFRSCMTDNGNGTITVTQVRPVNNLDTTGPTTTFTDTVNGSFPDGDVRVVMHSDSYDGIKHSTPEDDALGAQEMNTLHWDNLEVHYAN